MEKDPESFDFSSSPQQSSSKSSSATRKKRIELSVKKAREVDRWFADKNVKDPTDSENQILKHYDSYTRKSPHESSAPFKIINYDAERASRPLPEFLPRSVIVLITMHGRTKEPFKPEVNVVRHIGPEFGKCYYNYLDALVGVDELQLMSQGFKKKRKRSGEHIKASILKNLEEARLAAETKYATYKKNLEDWGSSHPSEKERYKRANPYEDEEFKGFIGSRHHVRPKKIKKNAPMFNKSFSMTGDDGRETHDTHTIYVRGDLPVDSPEKDALFEIHTENTTLETIFVYLAEKGVQDVTLFDLSCQEDRRSPIHRARYGGTVMKKEMKPWMKHTLESKFGTRIVPCNPPKTKRLTRRFKLRCMDPIRTVGQRSFAVDYLVQLFEKLKTAMNGRCHDCVLHFTAGIVRKNGGSCQNTCSYTASALAVLMRIVEKNKKLEKALFSGETTLNDESTDFYRGVLNTVALLWDVHDFQKVPDDQLKYARTGIQHAMNDPELRDEWFVQPPQLQEGINIVSIHYIHPGHPELQNIFVHHAFVYKVHDQCILVDSWRSDLIFGDVDSCEDFGDSTLHYDEDGEIVGESLSRPLTIRVYSLEDFNLYLSILSKHRDKRKIDIMTKIFRGLKQSFCHGTYKMMHASIVKQSKLDELMAQGFQADRYLYG